jgi:hypothetical protein
VKRKCFSMGWNAFAQGWPNWFRFALAAYRYG